MKYGAGMSKDQILFCPKPMFQVMSMSASGIQEIKICPFGDFAERWPGGSLPISSLFLAGWSLIHDSLSQFLVSYFDAIQN
jgi:hypothetical protein